jgi:protein transport protein SEC31
VGKEVVSLQYGGGAAKGMGTVGGVAGLQLGKRRGMSDVCWHPEQVSGLRGLVSRLGHPPDHRVGRRRVAHHNALGSAEYWGAGKSERFHSIAADRQILSGHHKGVLSVAWCEQDADLLLSCGKDNRTLCWNPQTGEIIGEVSSLI